MPRPNPCPQKLRGRVSASPVFPFSARLVFLLGSFLCLFLWCHGSILPSILHGLCNDLQLQLFECIESMKNEVKRKMTMRERRRAELKSQMSASRKKKISFFKICHRVSLGGARSGSRRRPRYARFRRQLRAEEAAFARPSGWITMAPHASIIES
jgi:hypothetical protein